MVQRNESQGDPVKLEEPIEPDSSRASAPCAPSGKAQDGAESSSGLAELLANTAGELHVAAQSLIEVYSDRVKQRVRSSIVSGVLAAAAAVVAIVWLSAAALATVRGIRGALTAWSGGRAWVGDLAGGVLALALAAGAVAIYLRLSARHELARLKAKYERIRKTHDEPTAAPARAGDGGSPPGPGGSAGDRAHHENGAAHG